MILKKYFKIAQNSLKTDIDRWPVRMVRLISHHLTAGRTDSKAREQPRRRGSDGCHVSPSVTAAADPGGAAFRYDPYPSSKHGLNSFFF
jgi:hypothetical protein